MFREPPRIVVTEKERLRQEREWAEETDRRYERYLEKAKKRQAKVAELRIGEQVFIRPYIVAKELGIQPQRLENWIRIGMPDGRMLQAMQTICFPRRFYIDQQEREWLLRNFKETKKQRIKSPSPEPQ
jgi:hypothetical protein